MERALLDASSYMFPEASGDSESDYYDTAPEADTAAAADDDAESCSCGSLSSASHETHGAAGDDEYSVEDDDINDDGFCTSEVEDGVVDQCRGGAAAPELNNSNKDSNSNNMNEREMDRLFWEACLAS